MTGQEWIIFASLTVNVFCGIYVTLVHNEIKSTVEMLRQITSEMQHKLGEAECQPQQQVMTSNIKSQQEP